MIPQSIELAKTHPKKAIAGVSAATGYGVLKLWAALLGVEISDIFTSPRAVKEIRTEIGFVRNAQEGIAYAMMTNGQITFDQYFNISKGIKPPGQSRPDSTGR